MSTRATCYTCRRTFDLPAEAATQRHCQYCGGDLSIQQSALERPADAAKRTDAVMGNCPICDLQLRFEPGERVAKCGRCGTDIIEPESPGMPARVAPSAVTAKHPPISVPCAHCGGRGKMPDEPAPAVRCDLCQRALTAAYLPLEKWADTRGLAQPGTLADTLLLILRGRWNNGLVAPGEVLRHVEGLRLVTQWLQTKPEERKSDFPLPVGAAAEVLKYFVLRVDKAEIQSQSADRAILAVPTKRDEPRESDTRFFKRVTEEDARAQPPAMILSIGQVPAGSVFGFLARGPDGTTGALQAERLAEVKQLIGAAAPRASFRFLAYRFIFGEWMRPTQMVFVPAAATERELRKFGMPEPRIKSVLERLNV